MRFIYFFQQSLPINAADSKAGEVLEQQAKPADDLRPPSKKARDSCALADLLGNTYSSSSIQNHKWQGIRWGDEVQRGKTTATLRQSSQLVEGTWGGIPPFVMPSKTIPLYPRNQCTSWEDLLNSWWHCHSPEKCTEAWTCRPADFLKQKSKCSYLVCNQKWSHMVLMCLLLNNVMWAISQFPHALYFNVITVQSDFFFTFILCFQYYCAKALFSDVLLRKNVMWAISQLPREKKYNLSLHALYLNVNTVLSGFY